MRGRDRRGTGRAGVGAGCAGMGGRDGAVRRVADGSLDRLLYWELDRSLDGLLEGPLDELYGTSLSTSSSILTTGELKGES